MHHTCSALHRPRAADRRRAQAQPAFKGYGFAGHFGRLKALHTTTAVGIAVSPCMPGPCWVGWGGRVRPAAGAHGTPTRPRP